MGDFRALYVAQAAVYDHHPSLKVQGIAAAWAEAGETARGVLQALADDGWSVLPTATVTDLERERDELLDELRAVERQRDRLLEQHVETQVAGPDAPWPFEGRIGVTDDDLDDLERSAREIGQGVPAGSIDTQPEEWPRV